jgi:hypothetical protein
MDINIDAYKDAFICGIFYCLLTIYLLESIGILVFPYCDITMFASYSCAPESKEAEWGTSPDDLK